MIDSIVSVCLVIVRWCIDACVAVGHIGLNIVTVFLVLLCVCVVVFVVFFNDTATTEIYTRSLVGSVRCV